MKVGRRLAIKVLNASKFALGRLDGGAVPPPSVITEPIDRSMLTQLAAVVADASAAFEAYDYARALERTESFFWTFCDDYLELVKSRAYGHAEPAVAGADGSAGGDATNGSAGAGASGGSAGTQSARAALALGLSVQLRLLAPFLPYVTEEVWSWWQTGSVHHASWPTLGELGPATLSATTGGAGTSVDAGSGDQVPDVLMVTAEVLGAIRRAKTGAKRSMRAEVATLTAVDTAERIGAISAARGDLQDAGNVRDLLLEVGDPARIDVTLTPED
jgi:valyl-tRNA synthetase